MVRSITLPTGVTLQYAQQGSAYGIPVIFLHGVTDSWRSFEPVLPHLPLTIHAFALTQRGHGDSTRPSDGYRYADMSEDVGAFMDALALPSAVIVGHSMGASVAQRFAIDHPDRVAGLVLMGAFATLYRHPIVQTFWDEELAALTDPVAPRLAREFQVSTLAREIDLQFLDTVVGESLKVPARVWQAAFAGLLDTPDFSHELAAVRAPTLLAWGDRDSYAQRTDQDVLRGRIPGAQLITYEGHGHAFHWENPARFAADLVSFIYERH
jgi:pimeloyl-ACP methyl ester carboxylesterase